MTISNSRLLAFITTSLPLFCDTSTTPQVSFTVYLKSQYGAGEWLPLLSVNSIDIGTDTGAQSALAVIDAALVSIDNERADLGAIQNRISYTMDNLANIQNNVSDARSRILDVDFARETSEMTKQQILLQSSSAMLVQANQIPQIALSLLQ
ncbi:hypothetical protein JQC92_09240 [Shewanella sp. 202IG2-18]|nr:hypothetical protein [Parashewanella hymeniacidonis]